MIQFAVRMVFKSLANGISLVDALEDVRDRLGLFDSEIVAIVDSLNVKY
jgi:Flp pilus assembly protein TadB